MNRLLILAKSTENNEYNWIWCEWKVYMSLCIPRRNVCIPLVFFCSAMNVCVRNGQKLQKLNVHIFSHVKNQLLTIVAERSEKFLKFFNFEWCSSSALLTKFVLFVQQTTLNCLYFDLWNNILWIIVNSSETFD